MRNITVNGKQYKWSVGRDNVCVRGENFKKVIPISQVKAKKWFVVYHNWDSNTSFSGKQFKSKKIATEFLKEIRALSGVMGESYMFSSDRFSSITPSTISKIISES